MDTGEIGFVGGFIAGAIILALILIIFWLTKPIPDDEVGHSDYDGD